MKEVGRTWHLGDIYIAVEADTTLYPKLRLGIVDILDSNELLMHTGGSEILSRRLDGVIFSDLDALLYMTGSGYWPLVSDQGAEGNYRITDLNSERLQALNYSEPVYRVHITLKAEA